MSRARAEKLQPDHTIPLEPVQTTILVGQTEETWAELLFRSTVTLSIQPCGNLQQPSPHLTLNLPKPELGHALPSPLPGNMHSHAPSPTPFSLPRPPSFRLFTHSRSRFIVGYVRRPRGASHERLPYAVDRDGRACLCVPRPRSWSSLDPPGLMRSSSLPAGATVPALYPAFFLPVASLSEKRSDVLVVRNRALGERETMMEGSSENTRTRVQEW